MLPDLHHFRGSYGDKGVLPLYRSADASEPNILPGLLELLSKCYGHPVTPEDFLAYVYGLLAQPAFTARFHKELETRELRVPLTRDAALFEQARAAGARLLWLHTYGERYANHQTPVAAATRRRKRTEAVPEFVFGGEEDGGGSPPPLSKIEGSARCTVAVGEEPEDYPEKFTPPIDGILRVGKGEFAPVSMEVFNFEVSGLKVVQSWLKYRMKAGAGKKSSPLDDIRPTVWTAQFTDELLELLWVLEHTLASYPAQAALLDKVLAGPLFSASELPPVPPEMRKPPSAKKGGGGLFEDAEDADE